MTNKDFFAAQWKSEVKGTVDVLKALPKDKMDYRPHPKNRSAFELMSHMTTHVDDLIEMADKGTIGHNVHAKFTTPAEAATHFETKSQELLTKINSMDEKTWNEKLVPFMVNGNKAFEAPAMNMAWTFLMDVIHHRGQMTTYLRPMGGKIPSVYGPTADTMEAVQHS